VAATCSTGTTAGLDIRSLTKSPSTPNSYPRSIDNVKGISLRAELNRERCSGHARCFAVAPEVFDIDDDGFCLPPPDEPLSAELEVTARNGVDACPENALRLVES
jgi:ferredoxin